MTAQELEKLLADVTPGEWRLEQDTTLIWGECNHDDNTSYGMGYPVAETRITPAGLWASRPDIDAGIANARLIAMAPTLARRVIAAEKMADALRVVCQHGRIDDSESRMNMCGASLAAWEAAQ